ncbi:MAG: hypothetical protein H7Y41_01405 [Hyphomonadaceae bacterium]|nr:hypothetical protein [Clostridia bacterium]
MKEINKLFWMRVFSVIIACILWLYVVDIQNPETTTTLKNIPVQYMNQEALNRSNLFMLNGGSTTISLKISGRRKILASINANMITAKIDLKELASIGEHIVPVQIEQFSTDFTVVEKIPYSISVNIDKMVEQRKDISVITTGNLKEQFMIDHQIITPASVILKAPSTVLSTITQARVKVDVSGQSNDFSSQPKVEFINAQGAIVDTTKYTLQPETVAVNCFVLKTKDVPIQIQTVGNALAPLTVAKTEATPDKVTIKGKGEEVDKVQTLSTEAINLEGVDKTIIKAAVLVLPDGIKLLNDPKTVQVRISLSGTISKSFAVPIQVENKDVTKQYSVSSDTVNITLNAPVSRFETLTANQVIAYVDVNGLQPGSYPLEIRLKSLPDFELVNPPSVTIEIK